MIINAAIRTHGGTEPPTCDLSFVRNEDRRLSLVVRGVPSGLTITKLVWTGQDAVGAQTFQKVITTTSALATVGQITDAGTLGIARATASFTPSDTVNWPATASHQLWAVLSDGNPYRCLTGTVRSATPIPLTLTTDTVPASVTVSPASPSIIELATQQFTAVVRNAGGQIIPGAVVTWSVPAGGAYASIDATGLATGLAIGTATIRATSGSVSGDATLGVTLDPTPATVTVSPSSASIATAATQQFTAVVKNANGTTIPGATVTWASLDTGIATVDATGLATGVSVGSAAIRCTSGTVFGDAALTVTSGANPNLPPAAQDALVLAWDAQRGTVLGPAYQLGSTPGADTNDPTFVAGPPAAYQFGADDYITFGDVLDAVFTNAAGWTMLSAVGVSAGDVAAPSITIAVKDDGTTAREVYTGLVGGKLRFGVFYAGVSAQCDQLDQNVAITAGRHVVGMSFDPSLARALRIAPYLNGAALATTYTAYGADGVIVDTVQPLRLGFFADMYKSTDTQRALYVYNRPLTAQEHSDNRAWIVADGWS